MIHKCGDSTPIIIPKLKCGGIDTLHLTHFIHLSGMMTFIGRPSGQVMPYQHVIFVIYGYGDALFKVWLESSRQWNKFANT